MSGHRWIEEQLNFCPICEQPVQLHQTMDSKFRVCCMNACCVNRNHFDSNLWGKAIIDWNVWTKKIKGEIK